MTQMTRMLRIYTINDAVELHGSDPLRWNGFYWSNDRTKRPPPTGTVERTGHSRFATRCQAEMRGGGSSPVILFGMSPIHRMLPAHDYCFATSHSLTPLLLALANNFPSAEKESDPTQLSCPLSVF
jgi:hypothetical protein